MGTKQPTINRVQFVPCKNCAREIKRLRSDLEDYDKKFLDLQRAFKNMQHTQLELIKKKYLSKKYPPIANYREHEDARKAQELDIVQNKKVG